MNIKIKLKQIENQLNKINDKFYYLIKLNKKIQNDHVFLIIKKLIQMKFKLFFKILIKSINVNIKNI